jgi:dihydropteroate synthase
MHQALPLGDGDWRGPAADPSVSAAALRARGWCVVAPLPDGAWRWRPVSAESGSATIAGTDAVAALEAARAAVAAPFPPEPRWMGILNLTPDSFSDGGRLCDGEGRPRRTALLDAARRMQDQGAAGLDLGAESTRPGAAAVPEATQLRALLPALEIVGRLGLPCSADTRSARVAEACLDAGARIINDVSGLTADPGMAPLAAARGCTTILMHARGEPANMAAHAHYRHLLGEVADELGLRVQAALRAGMNKEQIVLDPGIGFAKSAAQSRALLARCGALRALGFPLLVGPSRKSFLADLAPGAAPDQRGTVSLGAAALAAAQGAAWIRLHDGAGWDAVRAAAACARAAREEA